MGTIMGIIIGRVLPPGAGRTLKSNENVFIQAPHKIYMNVSNINLLTLASIPGCIHQNIGSIVKLDYLP